MFENERFKCTCGCHGPCVRLCKHACVRLCKHACVREGVCAVRSSSQHFGYRQCFCGVLSVQVSELQLNEAIASAVERSKLRREKSLWSIDGNCPS